MKSCEDVVDLLPDHLPALGALSSDERDEVLEVHEHVRGCVACAELLEDLLRTTHLLREQAPAAPALSADFADRVMAALPPAAPPPSAVAPGRIAAALAAGVLVFASGFGAASLRERPTPAVLQPTLPGPGSIAVTPAQVPEPSPTPEATPGDPVVVADAAPPAAPRGRGRPTTSTQPLERYVEEAGLVVRAIGALEQPDPHWLGVLSRRVEGAALIAQGDRLLIALDQAPASEDTQALRPLISATQVVLRKVRRSSGQEPVVAVEALRREVTSTGLLDAYRDLARPADGADEPPPLTTTASNDPL